MTENYSLKNESITIVEYCVFEEREGEKILTIDCKGNQKFSLVGYYVIPLENYYKIKGNKMDKLDKLVIVSSAITLIMGIIVISALAMHGVGY